MTITLIVLGITVVSLLVAATKALTNKSPQIISEWQYQPYKLEAGVPYVFEVNAADILRREDLEAFKGFLKDNGINAHVILTRTGNGLKPLQVKTHRESEEA